MSRAYKFLLGAVITVIVGAVLVDFTFQCSGKFISAIIFALGVTAIVLAPIIHDLD